MVISGNNTTPKGKMGMTFWLLVTFWASIL
jgi:hypothetical protein